MGDSYIYVLFRSNGHPFYVGKGRRWRINTHLASAMKGDTHKARIIKDMMALGAEMPVVKVAEGLTDKEACKGEMALIAAIGRHPHGPLVNHTDGGEGTRGYRMSAAAITKGAAKRKGRKRSPEFSARNSEIHKGKTISVKQRIENGNRCRGVRRTPPSAETRDKMATAARQRWDAWRLTKPPLAPKKCRGQSFGMRGKRHSTDTKTKMRESGRRRWAQRRLEVDT